MEINELTALVKVVQAGSFTRAAEIMGKQKAHLSRVIANLEKKLGVRLIERTTRALSLTEVGREVFERAVGILGAVEDTERVAQRMLAEPRGTLKLTCGVEFGMIAVSRWINEYMKLYPRVNVEADFTSRLIDLVHEGFDLAIRVGELSDSSLAARKLGVLKYGLFASSGYIARRGKPENPQDLMKHDHLIFSAGAHRNRWRLTRDGLEQVIEVTARIKVNNSFAVRDAAIASLGIAQLPWVVALPCIENGTLEQLLTDWSIPEIPVHALYPSQKYLTPKVRAFIDYAVEAFATEGN